MSDLADAPIISDPERAAVMVMLLEDDQAAQILAQPAGSGGHPSPDGRSAAAGRGDAGAGRDGAEAEPAEARRSPAR